MELGSSLWGEAKDGGVFWELPHLNSLIRFRKIII